MNKSTITHDEMSTDLSEPRALAPDELNAVAGGPAIINEPNAAPAPPVAPTP